VGGRWDWVPNATELKMQKVSNGVLACRRQFVGRLLPFGGFLSENPFQSAIVALVFRFLIKHFCCLLLILQFRSSKHSHLAANLKTFLIS